MGQRAGDSLQMKRRTLPASPLLPDPTDQAETLWVAHVINSRAPKDKSLGSPSQLV